MESSQNPSDLKKVQEMKVKLKQVSKILPYLEKYIAVNRQAEVQTLAVLRESCVVKLRELDTEYGRSVAVSTKTTDRQARLEKAQSLPSYKTKKRQLPQAEETDAVGQDISERLSPIPDTLMPEVPTREVDLYEEPAYAPIQPIKTKQKLSDEHYTKLEPNKDRTPPTEQYAELEFKHSGRTESPGAVSSVEYSTLHHSDRNVSTTFVPKIAEDVMEFNSQADREKSTDFSDSLASSSNVSVDIHPTGIEESVDIHSKEETMPTDSPLQAASTPCPITTSTPVSQTTTSVAIEELPSTRGNSRAEPSPSVGSSPSKSATPPPIKAKPKRPRASTSPAHVDNSSSPASQSDGSKSPAVSKRTASLAERMKVGRC